MENKSLWGKILNIVITILTAGAFTADCTNSPLGFMLIFICTPLVLYIPFIIPRIFRLHNDNSINFI